VEDDGPKPPRPTEMQRLFFESWWADQQEGITLRATHKMLREHLPQDEAFQRTALERLARLEQDAERDAEARTLNGKGHDHPVLPPPPLVPHELRPWWTRDPFKTIIARGSLILLAALGGWILHHLTIR
jgi:hypothetical protein